MKEACEISKYLTDIGFKIDNCSDDQEKSYFFTLTGDSEKVKELKSFGNYVLDGYYVNSTGNINVLFYLKDNFEKVQKILEDGLKNLGLTILQINPKGINSLLFGGFDVRISTLGFKGNLKELPDFEGLVFDGYASTEKESTYSLFYFFE